MKVMLTLMSILFLLTLRSEGSAVLINFRREALLTRFKFKFPVSVIKFDPSGKMFAAGVGRLLQIWKSPPKYMEFTPFRLLNTIMGHYDEILCIEWSADSRFILSGGQDATCRINRVDKVTKPVNLVAHNGPVIGCFFRENHDTVYTVSSDGAVYTWDWNANETEEHLSPDQLHDIRFSSTEGIWSLEGRHYLGYKNRTSITSCAYHKKNDLLVIGNSAGVFTLYAMPDFSEVHSLSITQHEINTAAIN
ncbi:MAG: hypothetical protein NXI00_23935, partial [Cytophagales bacterium]|nr:hypothetical protein [Cytophagales bacterium]